MNNEIFKIRLFSILIIFILNSCTDSSEETNPCTNKPEITIDNVIASVEGKSTGEISVSTNGGTSPYKYSVDGTNFQSSNIFSELVANDYEVTVQDANGCTNSEMATVKEVPEVFFDNQVKPIIDTNCQISNCHGSNQNIASWATYNDIKARAEQIKARTTAKTMPPTGTLPDAEIKLIADWVDQGAPNN